MVCKTSMLHRHTSRLTELAGGRSGSELVAFSEVVNEVWVCFEFDVVRA